MAGYFFFFNGICNFIVYTSCFPVVVLMKTVHFQEEKGPMLLEYLTFHSDFNEFTLN